MSKFAVSLLVVGVMATTFVPVCHADESAWDQLNRATNGTQDTGTTFDGSDANGQWGKGGVDTTVPTTGTDIPEPQGQPVDDGSSSDDSSDDGN